MSYTKFDRLIDEQVDLFLELSMVDGSLTLFTDDSRAEAIRERLDAIEAELDKGEI